MRGVELKPRRRRWSKSEEEEEGGNGGVLRAPALARPRL